MQYIADALKVLIDENIIKLEDLYIKSEEYVVKLLEYNIKLHLTYQNITLVFHFQPHHIDKPLLNLLN